MTLTATTLGLLPVSAAAQTDVSLEVGASQVGPAAGLDGDHARFGMAGVRASFYGMEGSGVTASLMFGRAFGDTTGGDFVSGVLSSALRTDWGGGWSGGVDAEFVGFQVRNPFPYTALAFEGGPTLSLRAGPVTTTAKGVLGVGSSRVELWRRVDGPSRTFEDDLWRFGATGEVLVGTGSLRAGLLGGAHKSKAGNYTSGGGRLVIAGSWAVAEIRADWWDTPLGDELTGGVSFVIPLSGWSFRGFFGKSEPDPLTLAEPGSGSGGLLVSRSLYNSGLELGGSTVPYEVLSDSDGTARVRIRTDAPAESRAVAVLGDFTLWEAVPMTRTNDGWVAELEVPHGTHHYGFLVNDEWYVPDDTQDVVPDEWGRVSAILVIEGAS